MALDDFNRVPVGKFNAEVAYHLLTRHELVIKAALRLKSAVDGDDLFEVVDFLDESAFDRARGNNALLERLRGIE